MVDGFSVRSIPGLEGWRWLSLMVPLPRFGPRPRLAAAEMLRPDALRLARRAVDPAVVAVYDDAVLQHAAFDLPMPADRAAFYRLRQRANLAAFRWHAVPTTSFAEMVGLDMSRVIVAGNGTDVEHIVPGEWPEEPAVGLISGATPGRGIETLLEAATLLRRDRIPNLRLLLWLIATGEQSAAYLEALRAEHARDRWIEIGTAPYEDLRHALRQATVLCVPMPPTSYADVALPVKLFDAMAAGRPQVVTPRAETRALIERHGVGVVADGDRPEDLAAALARLLEDGAEARRIGTLARRVAEERYHWPVVGDWLASEVLEREGGTRSGTGPSSRDSVPMPPTLPPSDD
jgi:glycosyltransferase involved in cell wall biosynthesis